MSWTADAWQQVRADADHFGQHMAHRMALHVVGAERRAVVHELAHPRVVARQLLEPAVAQQIHAAVADVDQRRVAVLDRTADTVVPMPAKSGVSRGRFQDPAVRARARRPRASAAGPAPCRWHPGDVVDTAMADATSPALCPPMPSATHEEAGRRSTRQASSLVGRGPASVTPWASSVLRHPRSIAAPVLYTRRVATSAVQAALARSRAALERGRGLEAVQPLQPLLPIGHAARDDELAVRIAHHGGLPAGRTTSRQAAADAGPPAGIAARNRCRTPRCRRCGGCTAG